MAKYWSKKALAEFQHGDWKTDGMIAVDIAKQFEPLFMGSRAVVVAEGTRLAYLIEGNLAVKTRRIRELEKENEKLRKELEAKL
jgi:hypothetical protein